MPVGGLRHRFTTSSRGNAYAVPRSTEFCCWFGNSKVVNADDTPKLVYHGTVNDFEVFEETKKRQRAFGFARSRPRSRLFQVTLRRGTETRLESADAAQDTLVRAKGD